jgi:uncharacterized damage-inducible protein DinB
MGAPHSYLSFATVVSDLLFIRHMKEKTSTLDGGLQRDPDEWKTGDEPMTAAQRSYLHTLSDEAGEAMEETLTKAQASERITALQQQTGRGSAGQGTHGKSDHGR